MIFPGDSLPIDKKTSEGLGTEIGQMIGDLETNNNLLFKDIKTWWRWYEATPAIQGQKNFPFKGASNIVVPLIQIMVDAFVNRAYAAIFGRSESIWMVKTEDEEMESQVKNVGRWINWAAANNDFNMRLTAYDQFLEMAVVGSSVLALNWREDVRWAYDRTGRQAQPVRFARGAFPEHIPREQVLWDTNHLISEAPVVVRELSKTWSELRNLAALDPSWNGEVIESLRGQGGREGPSMEITKSKRKEDSAEDTHNDFWEPHDIREVHMDYPLLGVMGFADDRIPRPGKERLTTPSPPLVATIHRKTGKVLRLIAEPYLFPYKPFFDIFYRKRSGRGHSVGISKKLEHMQRAMTTTLNQALDARTRANAVWAKTKRKDMLNRPIDPSHPIYDPDMQSFEAFNLPSAIFDDMRIMTAVQVIAERQTGQSDPALGRETRQGGHPSPATSTLALLDQSELMQGTTKELIRLQYSRLGEGVATLYQQFETNEDGKLQRVLGVGDAAKVEEFLFPTGPISGILNFDVTALSEANSPDSEMKKAVLISQMNQNYWIAIIRGLSFLENPQVGPIVKEGVMAAIKAGTQAHLRFLEAGDVDDLEKFVLGLADNAQAGSDDIRTAGNTAREIAGPSVGNAGVGVGDPRGPVPGGANGSAGAIGGF